MFFCFACLRLCPSQSNVYQGFCSVCGDDLSVSPGSDHSGSSLFLYRGVLRALTLRAKVHGDWQAMMLLCRLFVSHPRTLKEVSRSASVMAVPSSFWGRIRGKPDLAWMLTKKLSETGPVSMKSAPFQLFWRVQKRARARARSHCDLNLARPESSISTLIIDDVITTGYSINRLASAIGDSNCRYLTLSVATTYASHTGPDSGEF